MNGLGELVEVIRQARPAQFSKKLGKRFVIPNRRPAGSTGCFAAMEQFERMYAPRGWRPASRSSAARSSTVRRRENGHGVGSRFAIVGTDAA